MEIDKSQLNFELYQESTIFNAQTRYVLPLPIINHIDSDFALDGWLMNYDYYRFSRIPMGMIKAMRQPSLAQRIVKLAQYPEFPSQLQELFRLFSTLQPWGGEEVVVLLSAYNNVTIDNPPGDPEINAQICLSLQAHVTLASLKLGTLDWKISPSLKLRAPGFDPVKFSQEVQKIISPPLQDLLTRAHHVVSHEPLSDYHKDRLANYLTTTTFLSVHQEATTETWQFKQLGFYLPTVESKKLLIKWLNLFSSRLKVQELEWNVPRDVIGVWPRVTHLIIPHPHLFIPHHFVNLTKLSIETLPQTIDCMPMPQVEYLVVQKYTGIIPEVHFNIFPRLTQIQCLGLYRGSRSVMDENLYLAGLKRGLTLRVD